MAYAHATRGSYAVKIETGNGRVTAFAPVMPTDSLLAPCGIMDRVLASLPPEKSALGALILDILDPCGPVRLREVHDA